MHPVRVPIRDDEGESETDQALRQILLLHKRGESQAALKRLAELKKQDPSHPDMAALQQRILEDLGTQKATEERNRAWRYYLHMHTSTSRIGYGVVSIGLMLYSAWVWIQRLQYAEQNSFTATITTLMSKRYATPQYHTRPVYYDLLLWPLLFVVSAVFLYLTVKLSKNAAQWEELEEVSDKDF